ncbi:MAG: hypothetical protein KatS3mg121_0070 [Gammaproteobacteria bacterium]|nr:MAG: hypothetical protein KatS3mg121_0070 [Gammaproteobacteria bacterium]
MLKRLRDALWKRLTDWLTRDLPREDIPPCDFDRLRYEIRFCDVLLVEGRSRVSGIIQSLTLSPWTHAALYIGRLHAIDDPALRELILAHYPARPDEQLIIEALLGQGTIVAPLEKYRHDHVRLCRPNGISRKDAQAVIAYAASFLGFDYDVRQLLDLARFLFPYRLLPRRWRSSLFGQGTNARTICSTLIAEAFASVRYPVRPVLRRAEDGRVMVYDRNLKLYTPSDFDYSPYFDIIKYPIYGIDSPEIYRSLPWEELGLAPPPPPPPRRTTAPTPPPPAAEDDGRAAELAQQARDLLDEVEGEKGPD